MKYGNYRLHGDAWYIFGSILVVAMYVYLDALWWVVGGFSFFVFGLWAMNLRMGEVV